MTDIPKPSEKPRWATDILAAVTTPPSGKQDIGWIVEYPPHQFFNWLHKTTYEWINYFEAKTDTGLGGSAETLLTIAGGSITPTSSGHSIDTQGGGPTDDLTNIVTTNLSDGNLLTLHTTSAARVVTVKHAAGGAGQIHCGLAEDVVLEDPSEFIILKRIGADWYQVSNTKLAFDSSPWLSGDLDVKSKKITTSTLNGDVVIEPNGTGALAPLTSAKALGKTTARWNLFATGGDFSGDISAVNATFTTSIKSNDIDAKVLNDTLNIGATNALIINIGRVGATIALYGSVTEVHTTNTFVSDKTITLNDGGIASSGSAVGIEVEENNVITGYIKTSANRNKWSFLSPNSVEIISIGTEATVVGDIGIVSNVYTSKFNSYTFLNASDVSILESDTSGKWRIGPTTGFSAITHDFNGNIFINSYGGVPLKITKSNNIPLIHLTGTASNDFYLGMQSAGGNFHFINHSSISVGQFNQAGQWQIGPSAGFASLNHVVKGNLYIDSASGNPLTIAKSNNSPLMIFTATTNNDFILNNDAGTFHIKNNGGVSKASVTQAGAWIIGDTGITSTAQAIYGNLTVTGDATVLSITRPGSGKIQLYSSAGSAQVESFYTSTADVGQFTFTGKKSDGTGGVTYALVYVHPTLAERLWEVGGVLGINRGPRTRIYPSGNAGETRFESIANQNSYGYFEFYGYTSANPFTSPTDYGSITYDTTLASNLWTVKGILTVNRGPQARIWPSSNDFRLESVGESGAFGSFTFYGIDNVGTIRNNGSINGAGDWTIGRVSNGSAHTLLTATAGAALTTAKFISITINGEAATIEYRT